MKILFDTNAPDQTTFNIWILNLSNFKIIMKSIEADATPISAAEVIVESTDKIMEQLRNENENLKQKINSLELVVNDYKIRDKEQEKKIIDQLSYILSLETEAINLKSHVCKIDKASRFREFSTFIGTMLKQSGNFKDKNFI
jgi:hypothetical protein